MRGCLGQPALRKRCGPRRWRARRSRSRSRSRSRAWAPKQAPRPPVVTARMAAAAWSAARCLSHGASQQSLARLRGGANRRGGRPTRKCRATRTHGPAAAASRPRPPDPRSSASHQCSTMTQLEPLPESAGRGAEGVGAGCGSCAARALRLRLERLSARSALMLESPHRLRGAHPCRRREGRFSFGQPRFLLCRNDSLSPHASPTIPVLQSASHIDRSIDRHTRPSLVSTGHVSRSWTHGSSSAPVHTAAHTTRV